MKLICSTIISLAAIIGIIILEMKALSLGIDGIIFSGTAAIIAGIAGYKASEIIKIIAKKVKVK